MDALKLAEELGKEIVDNSLSCRYDICACSKCKKDVLNRILSKLSGPPASPNTENAEEIRNFYRQEISRALSPAIEYVSAHPSHIDSENRQETFKALLRKISSERGLDLRNYHIELLKRRIALRLSLLPLFKKFFAFNEHR